MSLSQEDLQAIGDLIDSKLNSKLNPINERLDGIENRLDGITLLLKENIIPEQHRMRNDISNLTKHYSEV